MGPPPWAFCHPAADRTIPGIWVTLRAIGSKLSRAAADAGGVRSPRSSFWPLSARVNCPRRSLPPARRLPVPQRRLGPVLHAELLEQVLDVELHRVLRERE